MADSILVINAGSSSIKFSLYVAGGAAPVLASKGQVEGINVAPHFAARRPDGKRFPEHRWDDPALTHEDFFRYILDWIDGHFPDTTLTAAGHRIVHGGAKYAAPVIIDDTILADLDGYVPLAPLHQMHNLTPIRALQAIHPGLPQVGCFDTAYHRSNPKLAQTYGLPRALADEGVHRYGFHGLSYEFVADRMRQVAPEVARGRVAVAHLGSGASLCAMRDGRSVASTMGLTALDGLVMGTRCGALDAGVLLYLMQQKRMDARQIETLLYHESGLLGVSGLSSDMRVLLASREAAAIEAIDLFAYRVGRELGSLCAAMEGLDALVFTAGIGEHSPEIRAKICRNAEWLGVRLDHNANASKSRTISSPDSGVPVFVVPTDEELMIAKHTVAALAGIRPKTKFIPQAGVHQTSSLEIAM